jgi:hypothetical protein
VFAPIFQLFILVNLILIYLFYTEFYYFQRNYSVINNQKNKKVYINNLPVFENKEFCDWFSGFVDAEGNFLIMIEKNKKIVRFRFAIKLHIEDINCLYYIKENLDNIGIVRKYEDKNYAEYIILNYNHIKNVIIPLFEKFELITMKKSAFYLFSNAVKLKDQVNLNRENGIKMSEKEFKDFNSFKLNMSIINQNVSDTFNIISLDNRPFWLLGFVEGEGTFGYKYRVPYFQIGQHKRSINALNSIENFLLKNVINLNNNSRYDFKMTKVLNKRTNVSSYTIQDMDILYKYIVPFFESMKFRSRKSLDFYLWSIAIKIRIYGYHTLKEGKYILTQISEGTNKFRYNRFTSRKETNIFKSREVTRDVTPLPSVISKNIEENTLFLGKEIDNLFSMPPIFNQNGHSSHLEQALLHARRNSSRKGYPVYIYENGIEMDISPFSSYASATKNIGLDSNVIRRYIDTGKQYKNKYTFYSFKQ